MIKVYRSKNGLTSVASGRATVLSDLGIDDLFVSDDPEAVLRARSDGTPEGGDSSHAKSLGNLPPIERQEVWAAGVTYKRSREARMEESEDSGGSTFYDMVYDADRPEIFFKATASRTVGSGSKVSVRGDSSWNVPEPELTLAINARGRIFGYTIGNDMSSRDIEGENPLYLPQAKVYRNCCALGPALCVCQEIPLDTGVALLIERDADIVFSGETRLTQLKRNFEELAGYLFRDNVFPYGAYLMTGTGIVPPNDFTLQSGDRIEIGIDGLGVLCNKVE